MSRHLFWVAVALASCNTILGNDDHYLVEASAGMDFGPSSCRLNSNCAPGDVCLFETCGPPCKGDQDCAAGSRCLRTDTGTACVSASAATCAAGCPAGTTCSPVDDVCRHSCEAVACLSGQTCSAGLCVGSEDHEVTPPDGVGGGGGSSNGSGGESAGGAPPAEPCDGVVCATPPASECQGSASFKTYDTMGSCEAGVCSYTARTIDCTCEDGMCTTDPCLTVTCDSPPQPHCTNPQTVTDYAASGTCSEGSCDYAPTDTPCEHGCEDGACQADPCLTITCDSPPEPSCAGPTTTRAHAATGSCEEGSCTYAPTDTPCPSNKRCDGAGVCSVCKTDASCGAGCGACPAATSKCKDLGATSKCVQCLSDAHCSGGTRACDTTTNTCVARSCLGLAKTCGPNGNQDCCASNLVTGGTFDRDNDVGYPATIANFRLDNYEITIGRFRKFVAVFSPPIIPSGSGRNPNNPSDGGWDPDWTSSLSGSSAMLASDLKCDGTNWTDSPGTAEAESRAIVCLTWFDAQAFCIWDGGRLPTEAEWSYAASGGSEQRTYPWGSTPPDCSYTNFNFCTTASNRVGSCSSKGDGLYGQSDLAGNIWEWVQDWHASPYTNPCSNCANLAPSSNRVIRGGGFFNGPSYIASSSRGSQPPNYRGGAHGARCARLP